MFDHVVLLLLVGEYFYSMSCRLLFRINATEESSQIDINPLLK